MFIQNSGHSIFHSHNEDSIHDIRHQHQPLGQLQHHASCVQTHTGGIHSSHSYSKGSESRTGDKHQHWHQHQGQLQLHASYVLGYTGDIHSSRGYSRGSDSHTGDQHQHQPQGQQQHPAVLQPVQGQQTPTKPEASF